VIRCGGDMRKPVKRYARRYSYLLPVAFCVLSVAPATAQTDMNELARRVGIQIAAEGRSDKRLRQQSIKLIPTRSMAASSRSRVAKVIDECAQYRRLPELHYAVEPKMYEYLIEHPDVAVSTWRAMEISSVQLWQTGPEEYEASAPDGSLGSATVLYRDRSQCLMLCDGTYSSPLLPKPITAAGLLWLRHDYRPDQNGQILVRQRLDVFVSFPSATARAMAALASPITNMMLDRNAFEISLYARMMSQAAESDPEWVEEIASRLEGVLPQRRQELASLVRPVETNRDRTAAVSGRAISSSRPVKMFRATLIRAQEAAEDETPVTDDGTTSGCPAADQPGIHHMSRHADGIVPDDVQLDKPAEADTDSAAEEMDSPSEQPSDSNGGWKRRTTVRTADNKRL
jgi:hypothetical protein